LLREVALEGLVEAFDLAAGLGVVGAGVLRADAQGEQLGFDGAAVVAAHRRREDGAVVGEERLGITPGRGGAVQGAHDIW
jgi:hypothetical protein